MSDVFISYSRSDGEVVRRLHARLVAEKRNVWVDWEDIPPSAEWLAEIERAIEPADTFVFVLSPDSVASTMCRHELDHAVRCQKRIVPVLARDVDLAVVPDSLRRFQWLYLRQTDNFDDAYKLFVSTIETDLTWVRAHSRLLVRAWEWETHRDDKSYLLAGTDLEEAERWLARQAEGSRLSTPPPKPAFTEQQVAYIAASRRRETERQRHQLRGFYLVSLLYGLLQFSVSMFIAVDEISEAGLIALAPLWVLGIVFGGFGLTFGRTSLKRSVVASALAGLLLYAFLVTVWRVL